MEKGKESQQPLEVVWSPEPMWPPGPIKLELRPTCSRVGAHAAPLHVALSPCAHFWWPPEIVPPRRNMSRTPTPAC